MQLFETTFLLRFRSRAMRSVRLSPLNLIPSISLGAQTDLLCFVSSGQEPDAVNLWIGGSHSQTSLHKDPYENLYAVLRGSKTFTVLPPTEGVLLGSE